LTQAQPVTPRAAWLLPCGLASPICAPGLLAAGLDRHVRDLILTFGRFAERGTMPNIIHGEDASNRDTSDAPLWYGIVCEELAALAGPDIYEQPVDPNRPRTVLGVLEELADGYLHGTPHAIPVEPHA